MDKMEIIFHQHFNLIFHIMNLENGKCYLMLYFE